MKKKYLHRVYSLVCAAILTFHASVHTASASQRTVVTTTTVPDSSTGSGTNTGSQTTGTTTGTATESGSTSNTASETNTGSGTTTSSNTPTPVITSSSTSGASAPGATGAPAFTSATASMAQLFTSIVGQTTSSAELQTATPDSLIVQTVLINGPSVVATPSVTIALSNSTSTTAAYAVTLTYIQATSQYTVYAMRSGSNSQVQPITISSNGSQAKLFSLLENWRLNGFPLPCTLQYIHGSILFCINDIPVWFWQDQSPLSLIAYAGLSSATYPQIFINTQVQSAVTTTTPYQPSFFLLNPSQATLITFSTQSLPRKIVSTLWGSVGAPGPGYSLLFDTVNNCHVRLTESLTNGSLTSDIPNSSGAYDVPATLPSATQTYFILYAPAAAGASIAFGYVGQTGSSQLQPQILWTNPNASAEKMNFLVLQTDAALSNIQSTTGAQLPSFLTTLGYNASNSSYTALNRSAPYTNGSLNWANAQQLPAVDCGTIQFNLSPSNSTTVKHGGGVILFNAQAQGIPTYGVSIEPYATYAPLYGTASNAMRIRAFSFSATGTPQPLCADIVVNTQMPASGTFSVSYQKLNATDTCITLSQVSNGTSTIITQIPIPAATLGMQYAVFSSRQETVTYNTISISQPSATTTLTNAATNASTESSSSSNSNGSSTNNALFGDLTSLTFTNGSWVNGGSAQAFTFPWGSTPLTQTFSASKGFSFSATISSSKALAGGMLAFGFSQTATGNTTQQFVISSLSSAPIFKGANELLLLGLGSSSMNVARFSSIPTNAASNATSPMLATSTINQGLSSSATHQLWITCVPTSSTQQTIAIGIDTPIGTSPLYSWTEPLFSVTLNGTTSSVPYSMVVPASISTDVVYANIQYQAYTGASGNTAPGSGNSGGSGTGSGASGSGSGGASSSPQSPITISANAPLAYTWFPGLDKTNGGYISALCSLTAPEGSASPTSATLMIGFASATDGSAASYASTNLQQFQHSQYNIQIQANTATSYVGILCTDQSGTVPSSPSAAVGYSATSTSSSGTTPQNFTQLLGNGSSGSTLPTFKIWAGCVNTSSGRVFSAGITSATDTTAISSLTPLWTWTEPSATSSKKPTITAAGITSWGVGCTLSGITVTPATNTSNAPAPNMANVTYNGTLSASNAINPTQWTTVAYTLANNTISTLTLAGQPTDRIVFAFSPNVASPTNVLFSVWVDQNGISLYTDSSTTPVAQSTAPNLAALATPPGTTYWMSFVNNTFSMGVMASSNTNAATQSAPLLTWTSPAIKQASPVITSFVFTYGATQSATVTYGQNSTLQATKSGETANAINRTLYTPSTSTSSTGLTVTSGQARPLPGAAPSSRSLALAQQRVNTLVSAQSRPPV